LAQLQLRPSGQQLFGVLFDGTQNLLGVLEDTGFRTLVPSLGPIQGPQASGDGTLWIAQDGVLMRARDTADLSLGFEAVGEELGVTCLGHWRSLRYACVGTDVYALGDAGLEGRIVDLNGVAPPGPELVTAVEAAQCEVQWSLFRFDLERSGLTTGAWTAPELSDAGLGDAGLGDAAAPEGGGIATSDAGAPSPSDASRDSTSSCSAARARVSSSLSVMVLMLVGLALALRSARSTRL
jgi:hypothetical protein